MNWLKRDDHVLLCLETGATITLGALSVPDGPWFIEHVVPGHSRRLYKSADEGAAVLYFDTLCDSLGALSELPVCNLGWLYVGKEV